MRRITGVIGAAALAATLAACGSEEGKGRAITAAELPVAGQTEPAGHEANDVAIWTDSARGLARIYGSAGTAGVEIFDLTGQRLDRIATGGEAKAIALLDDFEIGGRAAPLLAALDVHGPALRIYAVNREDGALAPVPLTMPGLSGSYEGLCGYTSPVSAHSYLFLTDGDGRIQQWWLEADRNGALSARLARELSLGSEVTFCAGDPMGQSLYIAEKEVGFWRIAAEVESDATPEVVDIVRFGQIGEEVGGLAVYRNDDGLALLVASNAGDSVLHVYDINDDHQLLGAVTLAGQGDIGAVEEAGGLAISTADLGGDYGAGILLVMDDDNGDLSTNYKMLPWSRLAAALDLAERATVRPDAVPASRFAAVKPTGETEPVDVGGDAADDPAIWIHPEDPAQSTIIATDKQNGLYVYDLDGKVIQFLPDGMMNNVDVRSGFMLDGVAVDVVAASNRSNDTIALYRIDAETRRLHAVGAGPQPTGMNDSYGLCMYRNRTTGDTHVIVNGKSGLIRQWQLIDNGDGRIATRHLRDLKVDSQPEGYTADDDHGYLYVGEEDVALWKFAADPQAGDAKTMVTSIASNPPLKDDIEGVAIYYGPDGAGYIIVSSQGNDSYAVFDRTGDHAYRGSFVITANGELGIDGASETDGLEVTSTPLGDKYPHGLLVVQDGRNLMPREYQNYKLVPWDAIAEALQLP